MTPAKNEPGTLRERIAPFRAKGSGGCLAGNVATFAPRSHLVPRSLTIRREAESNFLQHLGWGVAKNADQKNQYLTLDACAQLAQKPINKAHFSNYDHSSFPILPSGKSHGHFSHCLPQILQRQRAVWGRSSGWPNTPHHDDV
jgi:hypothetical protein